MERPSIAHAIAIDALLAAPRQAAAASPGG
jgi:hypothetical protein